jgi:hypothetical protein
MLPRTLTRAGPPQRQLRLLCTPGAEEPRKSPRAAKVEAAALCGGLENEGT